MFLIKYTETLDHDIEDIDTLISLYQTHERLITENLIKQVIPSFTKISFFEKNCPQELKLEDFIRKALPYFRYEEFEFGDIIYNLGDQNDKMYIVLDGSAMEFIHKKNYILHTQEQNTPSNQKNKRCGRQIEIWELVMQIQYQNPVYWNNGQRRFQYNITYKVGENFGDLSVDTITKESVIASSQLQCISIKKSDYKMIFGRELAETRKNLDFLNNLFEYVSENKLLQFINLMKKVTYDSKHQLWQQGDNPQFMIFIIDGLVETYYYENITQDNALVRRNKISIREQSVGTLVGAEEILGKKIKRDYNCQCLTQTTAFVISGDQIPKLSSQFHEILRQMKVLTQRNLAYVQERKIKLTQHFRKISQPSPQKEKFTEDIQLKQEYFSPRKLISSQIRSSQNSQLNLDQIISLNQNINKSSQLDGKGFNTIYPIENSDQAEILLRFQIKNGKQSSSDLRPKSNVKYLRKAQKKIIQNRFKDSKALLLSPQILVSKISSLKSSRQTSPLMLDNTLIQQIQARKSKISDLSTSKNKQSTQMYSARSSNIDFENQILSLLKPNNFSSIINPVEKK